MNQGKAENSLDYIVHCYSGLCFYWVCIDGEGEEEEVKNWGVEETMNRAL